MSLRSKKMLAILLVTVVMAGSGWLYLGQKDRALTAAYSGAQYTRIAEESRLFLRQIEELTRFAEEAELAETMRKLLLTSSYIQGAYITSAHFTEFVASAGIPGAPDTLPIPMETGDRGGWYFSRQGETVWIILPPPIQSVNMEYLYVRVNGAAIEAGSADVRRQAGERAVVLFSEAALAAVLVVVSRKKISKHPVLRCGGLAVLTVLIACGGDVAIEGMRLRPDLTGTAKQSTQRVVQIIELQRDWARGGTPGLRFLDDLSGHLRRVEQDAPFLESVYPGEDDLLRAQYSTHYVDQSLRRTALAMCSPFHPITDWLPLKTDGEELDG